MNYGVVVFCLLTTSCLARSNFRAPATQNGRYSDLENSKVALKLYHLLAEENKNSNFLFSPVSLTAALGMIEIGANGETKNEITKAFDLEEESNKLRKKSSLGETYETISKISNANVTVKTFNKVFADEKIKIFDHYKNALKVYNANVKKLKFQASPGQTAHEINKDVSPNNMRIIHENQVDRNDKLVLTNVFDFQGDWHSSFDLYKREKRSFYVTHHDYINVQMMYQRGLFRYTYIESLTLHVLELPYAGKELSLVVMMPDNFDLPLVEEQLTSENLDKWLSELKYKTVEVVLPRFEMQQSTNMKNVFNKMNIKTMFDLNKCDLSGMTNDKIKVDQILHAVRLKVSPHGGSVEAEKSRARETPTDDVTLVYLDHPFVMLLRSNPTPTSFTTPQLFMIGRFAVPNGRIIYGRNEL